MPERIAIFGLGNPGPKYFNTRHNIGFDWINSCVSQLNAPKPTERFQAEWCQVEFEEFEIHFLKPLTFMNLSGQSVKAWREKYPSATKFLVAFDEMDIPLGRVRLREKGSDGGHRGLRSILELNSEVVVSRLRLGVGRPDGEAIDYVLGKFTPDEKVIVKRVLDAAVSQLRSWLTQPFERAMNEINGTDYSVCP